jgi:hypothetical protein
MAGTSHWQRNATKLLLKMLRGRYMALLLFTLSIPLFSSFSGSRPLQQKTDVLCSYARFLRDIKKDMPSFLHYCELALQSQPEVVIVVLDQWDWTPY